MTAGNEIEIMRLFLPLSLIAALALIPNAEASPATEGAIPDDMHDLAQKAAEEFKADRFDQAVEIYQKIIQAHPDSVYAWSNLGVTRFQQRRYDDAIQAFEASISINPNDRLTHYDLSRAYEAVGRQADADRELKKARDLQSKRPPLENTLPKPRVLT